MIACAAWSGLGFERSHDEIGRRGESHVKHIHPMSVRGPQSAQTLLATLLEILTIIRSFASTVLVFEQLTGKKDGGGDA